MLCTVIARSERVARARRALAALRHPLLAFCHSPHSTTRLCRRTVEENARLLREQTDAAFTVGQCLVSDENYGC